MLGNGVVLIGPGSEWLWAAISGIVLAATFIALYRQVRLQRSQNAIEQLRSYSRDWDSERMLRYRLAVLLAIGNGLDTSKVALGQATIVASFWENIGYLARAGHVSPALLWNGSLGGCVHYWLLLEPFAKSIRRDFTFPAAYEYFEWLAHAMGQLEHRRGGATSAEVGLPRILEYQTTLCEDLLRGEDTVPSVPKASRRHRVAPPGQTGS